MPILVGPSALWPTQPKFWVGHGPPGPRCSAPHDLLYYTYDLLCLTVIYTLTISHFNSSQYLVEDNEILHACAEVSLSATIVSKVYLLPILRRTIEAPLFVVVMRDDRVVFIGDELVEGQ